MKLQCLKIVTNNGYKVFIRLLCSMYKNKIAFFHTTYVIFGLHWLFLSKFADEKQGLSSKVMSSSLVPTLVIKQA